MSQIQRDADSGAWAACRRVAELADLRWHWGPAYRITAPHGMFRAERRDDGAAVSCATAGGLRALIRDDYAARPVPREG